MDKYYIGGREFHMAGEFVCVAWNAREVEQQNIDEVTYGVTIKRISRPYIDFIDIRHDDDWDEFHLDEDSPVKGGLTLGFAKQIYKELGVAIEYLESLENE